VIGILCLVTSLGSGLLLGRESRRDLAKVSKTKDLNSPTQCCPGSPVTTLFANIAHTGSTGHMPLLSMSNHRPLTAPSPCPMVALFTQATQPNLISQISPLQHVPSTFSPTSPPAPSSPWASFATQVVLPLLMPMLSPSPTDDRTITSSTRSPHTSLWQLSLSAVHEPAALHVQHAPLTHSSPQNLANSISFSGNLAKLMAFAHTALFSPSLSTLCTALNQNLIMGFPSVTSALVRKHLPCSVSTIKGHLYQLQTTNQQ
jgi:hypothetical protein